MKKILIILGLIYQCLFGFVNSNANFEKEIEILRNLDIDPSFASNDVFLSMKENIKENQIRDYINVLKKGYAFIPTLQKIIEEEKIPESFLYLAMAESNFSPKASSRVRAGGLWQFMPRTARKMGLRINRHIDERFDPIKSTKAATAYLKFLYNRFKKWYLVAIAYNCGEGKLSRALKRAGTDDLKTLLDPDKKYIPKESRRYIKKILLMAHIANDTDLIVKNDATFLLNRSKTDYLQTISIKGGTTLKSVAKKCKISYKELRFYNAHIKRGYIPRSLKKCNIYIPYQQYIAFRQNPSPLVQYKRNRHIKYRIKKGDTLGLLARKFNTKITKIKLANNMKTAFLRTGKSIVIPR